MTESNESIARTMASAPPRESKPAAKANPVAKLLGSPSFRLVTNPKWYEDKNDKNKQSMRLAFVDFGISGLTLSASVYLERAIEQRADGRYARVSERLSMPKGLTVSKDDSETIMHLEAFKNTTLDAFDVWRTGVEKASGGKMGKVSGRQVGDIEKMVDA